MRSHPFRSLLLLAATLSLALLGLAGCGGGTDPEPISATFLLRIESPEAAVKVQLYADEGRSITVDDQDGAQLTFTVGEVGEESAEVAISEPVTPIDSDDDQPSTGFHVANGTPASFTTASGFTWTVTYEEITIE